MRPTTKLIFDLTEVGEAIIYVPALVFAEILYLSERQRITVSLSTITNYFSQFSHYKEYPMSFDVICAAAQITDIPELHDRIIAGTARLLNLELITNDPVIRASQFVKSVW
jgi:predicted nucleic acid-binding protein